MIIFSILVTYFIAKDAIGLFKSPNAAKEKTVMIILGVIALALVFLFAFGVKLPSPLEALCELMDKLHLAYPPPSE